MTKPVRLILIALTLGGAALATLLLLNHHGLGEAAASRLCGGGENAGCDLVISSPYASVFGVSLAAIGLAFYASMFLLFASSWFAASTAGAAETPDEPNKNNEENDEGAGYVHAVHYMAFLLFGLALAINLVLFGVQAMAIGAYCRLCLGTYLVNAIACGLLWPARHGRSACDAQWQGAGRGAIWTWLAASGLLFGAAIGAEAVFAEFEGQRQANLLGGDPASLAPGSDAQDESSESSQLDPVGPLDEATGAGGEDPAGAESVQPSTPPDSAAADLTALPESEKFEALERQLAQARAEAQRLQETLDDPQKLETYQLDKAASEYQAGAEEAIALDGVPFKGPGEAPIQVVEYSDFMCPFCRNLAGALSSYLPQSEGKVSIHFKNYPLDQACNSSLPRTVHEGACEIALGAVCAGEQDKFWPFHDRVFAEPPARADRNLVVQMAVQAGLNDAAFRTCMDSKAAADRLEADISEARRLGVASTPTVYINGKKLESLNAFLAVIESEKKRLGF